MSVVPVGGIKILSESALGPITPREDVTTFIDWYEGNREWYEPLVLAS